MAQLEFRDGVREVPDHLADLMKGLDTYQMTFEQAQVAANNSLVRDRLNNIQSKVVAEHLKRWGI